MEDIKKYLKIVEPRGVLGAEDGGLTLLTMMKTLN